MYNRMETMKIMIQKGDKDMALLFADFFASKGKIEQLEYDELTELAYPAVVGVVVE